MEIAMLIQAAAFMLLAGALVALSLVTFRLIGTLDQLRRQIELLTGFRPKPPAEAPRRHGIVPLRWHKGRAA